MLHRTCDLGPVRAVTASVSARPAGLTAEFRLEGLVSAIILPPPAPAQRTDELWRSTCFEVFWQPLGETAYTELNLAPSGQWAAYDFDAYREGMRDAPVERVAIDAGLDEAGLVLRAEVAARLPAPAQVGLSAVIAHPDGSLQYWALAFPPGRPDFHSEACRQLILER